MLFFVVAFSGIGLKHKNLPFFSSNFLKFFLQLKLKLSEFVCENKFKVFSCKLCVKKIYIGNNETLDKEIWIILWIYLYIFNIKLQSENKNIKKESIFWIPQLLLSKMLDV